MTTTQTFGYLERSYCVDSYLVGVVIASLATQVLINIGNTFTQGLETQGIISRSKEIATEAQGKIDILSSLGAQIQGQIVGENTFGNQVLQVISKNEAIGIQVDTKTGLQHAVGVQVNQGINRLKALGTSAFSNLGGDNMSAFEGAIGIKTIRDNETKIILVDGQSTDTATKKLTIAQDGDAISAGTNDFGVPVLGNKSGNLSLITLGAEGIVVEIKDAGGDALNINADGSIPITDNGGSLTVDATNLDIRDLVFATDKVDVSGSAVTVSATDLDIRDLAFATDSVDVSGSSITVASGNITVSATDLDIRDLTHVSDSVKIGDGTNLMGVSANNEAKVRLDRAQAADGATAPAETVQVGGKDGSGNIQTIRTDTAGNIYAVVVPPASQTLVDDYKTTATAGVGTPITHDYTVTNGKTFKGANVLVGARGQVYVRVGTYNGTTFTPKMSFWQQPMQNHDHAITSLSILGDGTNKIRVEITNKDGQSSDVESTLQGIEE